MRFSAGASLLLLLAACGRTPLLERHVRDAGPPRSDVAFSADTAAAIGDAATDAAVPDGRPVPSDARGPVACSALAGLASGGLLTPSPAKQVLFSKDRSVLVLRVEGLLEENGDEVLVFRLPDGEISGRTAGAVSIDWIDGESSVLLRTRMGHLTAFRLDPGKLHKTLATDTCEHRVSPDGTRIVAYQDCDFRSATLSVIDTRTGETKTLGRAARDIGRSGLNVVFSPSGAWIAYLEPAPVADGSVSYLGVIHVVDRRNRSYALNSVAGASRPHFASDETLLFSANHRVSNIVVDVRAHTLGGGDSSWVIARGVSQDLRPDYRVSPDGQRILAALIPVSGLDSAYALSAYSLDGREVALSSDLYPFWTSQALWYSYAFSADNRHVVYLNAKPARGVSVLASTGGAATSLSLEGDFVMPPVGNLVALSERQPSSMRLRLIDLDTAKDAVSAEIRTAPEQVTFTPDGLSVVYAEPAFGTSPVRFSHLSSRTGVTTRLATWRTNQLATRQPCCNEPGPGYPIDPTGCFTVVASDVEGGTRLILLP